MTGESFQRRVELLRDSWAERRQLKGLASVHDFESQLSLLSTLHSWAEDATADVLAVYGNTLTMNVSPPPDGKSTSQAFSVTLGESYTVTFSLTERRRMGGSRWFISVTVGAGGPGGSIVAAGPERRNGQWTRGRLEDILLSVLGAYERALSEGGKPHSVGLRARGA
ncbi:MAG: hypothetical protein ABI577_13825 [bacterium]